MIRVTFINGSHYCESGKSVKLSIYSIKGQLIELYKFNSGHHEIVWDALEESSGIYFYQLKTKYSILTRKMLLLK